MGLDVLGAAYIFQIPTLLNVRVLRFDRGRLATVRRAKDPQDARVLAARKKAQ